MPLRPGGIDVDDVKVGSSQVSSIWQGVNLVWPIVPSSAFVAQGRDPFVDSIPFTAVMPIGEEIPLGWIIVVAVQVRNTVLAGIEPIFLDGVVTTTLSLYEAQPNCGTPGAQPWSHGWRSGYDVWGGGVLGEVTTEVAVSVGTSAFVWAFDPKGFNVSAVVGTMTRSSTEGDAGVALNNSDKAIHINIANSTHAAPSGVNEYTETGTPSPSTVELLLEGPDNGASSYPMMMVNRINSQPAGGVPWELSMPGTNTGLGRYQMELILT